ncbi:MAG: futalosine synthase [Desulfuromonas sp.]|mgnify:CR=1 FL=1|nr:MAG: futalosine synthase [Desulfuromonas sp.]
MPLTLGHISYLNCVPWFRQLEICGFSGKIIGGVPSELNALLARGEIDVSPSSSFEYGRSWRDYLLLPGHAIGSVGPVRSVLLFSSRPLSALATEPILLTGESATSVNLLKVLLAEYYNEPSLDLRLDPDGVEACLEAGGSALLIGDRALQLAQRYNDSALIYDLGDLWYHHTSLPFVFALWIVRRAVAASEEGEEMLKMLLRQLDVARERSFADLASLAASCPEKSWMGEEGLIHYWRSMTYHLSPEHQQGLALYFKLCVRHGLLSDEPQLRFFA